jgi:flagellar motor switch protein FliN/FliY
MSADENVSKYLDGATPVVKVSFDMEIEGLLKSKLLQIMSIEMAKDLISSLMHVDGPEEAAPQPKAPAHAAGPVPSRAPAEPPPAAQRPAARPEADKQRVKSVKPASFASFEEEPSVSPVQDISSTNFDLINDIPLQVTVELGKTKKNLSDVLNFGIGSIIVLDKQAGELWPFLFSG